MNKSKIFISYSHRGNGLAWKDRLIEALAVFEKQHLLDLWHDEEMGLGENWHGRIKDSMQSAELAVLLLTDEMLKSPFVLQHEFPELERRHRGNGLIIAPILCEKCDWSANEWVASLQIKPRVQTEPTSLAALSIRLRHTALRKIATEIAEQISHATLAELPKPDAPLLPKHIYLDKFPLTRGPGLHEEKLIGREQELALLDLAFAQPQTVIATLVAWGGVGKTMLVQHWLRRLQNEDWYGVRRVYAWSFYSQGTTEDRQASEDTFLAHALEWFGVQCEPTLSPWDKGRLLADAILKEPTLLVLDGIEPLQYPPGPMGGQLRAPGVQSLLKQFARKASDTAHPSLCLVTTREPLTDLADFERRHDAPWGSGLRVNLGNLTEEAGAALLHHAGAERAGAAEIKNDDIELIEASREVDGHALTLNLLGRFLARAHDGDIRRRDLVKFEEADRKEQGGTTFKMLAVFENWFANEGDIEARSLSILRMLGLFDCPADAGCLSALRKPPVIPGLTEPLFALKQDLETKQINEQPLSDRAWNDAAHFLADFGLVMIQANSVNNIVSFDCHPLIREYFATQVNENIDTWPTAQKRLYEYLKSSAPYQPDTLDGLQPLYQAVKHGCKAGIIKETCDDVFFSRIERGNESYAFTRVGAISEELSAVSSFFRKPWGEPAPELPESDRAWILNEAGIRLQRSGRIREAIEPLRASLKMREAQAAWQNAANIVGNLSDLEMTLGEILTSIGDAKRATAFAKRAGAPFQRISLISALGDALHQAGHLNEAMASFQEAEDLQAAFYPDFPLLNAIRGSRCCELLLDQAERIAWRVLMATPAQARIPDTGGAGWSNPNYSQEFANFDQDFDKLLDTCLDIHARISKSQQQTTERSALIDVGYEYFVMGLAALYYGSISRLNAALSEATNAAFKQAKASISVACEYMRKSGQNIPRGLFTYAWLCIVYADKRSAQANLNEAWDIAQRGPMRLHMADIHLYRARLFLREEHYPWESPQADLAAAEKLINECGYHRRDEELADAKRAILGLWK